MSTAINDSDEWQQLSNDEQRDILQQGFEEELGREPGVGEIPRWEDTDEVTQEQTLAAIEGALDETWTALLFDDEPRKTVPFEVRELSEADQDELLEWMQVFGQLEQAEADSVEELRDEIDDADELMGRLDQFESWMTGFLAEITTGEAFDSDWWAAADFPGGTRIALFEAVVERYEGQMTGAESFQ